MTSTFGGANFFADAADDEELESRNATFWEAMIDHIRRDGFSKSPSHVLDVGCHRGGLLARIAELWSPQKLIGIEPLPNARTRARLRLGTLAPTVELYDPSEWGKVAVHDIDLVVCHEVLFLIADIGDLIANLGRVLAPTGRAYVVMGCHAENPVWPAWQKILERQGRRTFSHSPIELMRIAGRCGLLASVRPLRETGWATHDPTESEFTFPSVEALLEHQFRQKLLFRLVPR